MAAVNVTVSTQALPAAAHDPVAGRLEQLLRQLPTDVDLWDADDDLLAVAGEAWEVIRTLDEDGHGTADRWVTASKLLARKRPRLVPLYDEKVRRVVALADGTDWWLSLREALRRDLRGQRGAPPRPRRRCREASVPGYVSVLRSLDVIIWSLRHGRPACRRREPGRRTPL